MSFDPRRVLSTAGYGVDRLTCLVYGEAGVGKTTLAKTTGALDKTVILGAEPGLLSLRDVSIPYYEIDTMDTLDGALSWLEGLGAKGRLAGRWVILDSITEIAERLLRDLKARPKSDPRAAYGDVQTDVTNAMRRAAALPCSVVFIAKQDRLEDGDGRILFGPAFPGKKLGAASPYQFDLVMAMRVGRDKDGRVTRWLQTEADGRYTAKDRSGALDPAELPDLAHIAAKIAASVRPPTPETLPTEQPTTDTSETAS